MGLRPHSPVVGCAWSQRERSLYELAAPHHFSIYFFHIVLMGNSFKKRSVNVEAS